MKVIANVESYSYHGPTKKNEKLMVFDITPEKTLNNPVTLFKIIGDNRYSDFQLVKFSQLSVIPIDKEYWEFILELSN